MRIVLEHLTFCADSPDTLTLLTEARPLDPGLDPVIAGFARHVDALSHSTSWRAEGDDLILTFAHVLPDATSEQAATADSAWCGTPAELEALPPACHAVRHLHFLRFTDEAIAATEGVTAFWAFAQQVADQHYPAVAGLLAWHGLDDDFVI